MFISHYAVRRPSSLSSTWGIAYPQPSLSFALFVFYGFFLQVATNKETKKQRESQVSHGKDGGGLQHGDKLIQSQTILGWYSFVF